MLPKVVQYTFGPLKIFFFLDIPPQQWLPYSLLFLKSKRNKRSRSRQTHPFFPKPRWINEVEATEGRLTMLPSSPLFPQPKLNKNRKISHQIHLHGQILETSLHEDIGLFGSYTILVHSITMFFLVTMLFLLFTICIMDFFNYIPGRFKSMPTIVGSPQLPVDAPSMASPRGWNFPI